MRIRPLNKLTSVLAFAAGCAALCSTSASPAVAQVSGASGDVIPTPAHWKRDALRGRSALFSGEVVQVFSPVRESEAKIFVLATTLDATISKSSDGKMTTVDQRVTPVHLKTYVTKLVESHGAAFHRIAASDTHLCGGRPGMSASYVAPGSGGDTALRLDFAAQQSGPYIIDVLYMHAQQTAADPAALEAMRKLCVPPPAILEASFGVRGRR